VQPEILRAHTRIFSAPNQWYDFFLKVCIGSAHVALLFCSAAVASTTQVDVNIWQLGTSSKILFAPSRALSKVGLQIRAMSSASGSNNDSDAESSHSSASDSNSRDSSDTESEHSSAAATVPNFQQEADRMLQLSRVMDQTFARLSMRFPRTHVAQAGPSVSRLPEASTQSGGPSQATKYQLVVQN
jgi:hypothetical protein